MKKQKSPARLNLRSNLGGFTLIELLVVIAIIGVLSSIVLVTLNAAREKARDARRKSDLKAIEIALEMYYDNNDSYPPEGLCTDASVGCKDCGCAVANFPNGDDWDAYSDLRDLVTEGFLSQVPIDPINNSTYYYWYEPNGVGQGSCTINVCEYYLRAKLESDGSIICVGQLCP